MAGFGVICRTIEEIEIVQKVSKEYGDPIDPSPVLHKIQNPFHAGMPLVLYLTSYGELDGYDDFRGHVDLPKWAIENNINPIFEFPRGEDND